MNIFFYETEVGKIGIAESNGFITHLTFCDYKWPKNAAIKETPLIKKAYKQLEKYLQGKLKKFDLPLNPDGTPFQKQVWSALQKIPYGKTCSYQDLAISIGNPKSCRAVGLSNNKNPIAIVIPCHRVIGKSGKLTGYAGGLNIKQKLLKLENCVLL